MAVEEEVFSAAVVEAAVRHINTDHAEAALLIGRALGGHLDATSVTVTSLDSEGLDLSLVSGGREVALRLPWSEPLRERAQLRAEVVRMYQEARALLGLDAPDGPS